MSVFFNTPLLRKEENKIEGKTIWYKMDALQPTGSFKVRGMENAARKAAERGCKKLLSSSGGNAGMAVAFVGRSLGLPVKVVLPKSTPHSVAGALKNLGAAVEINGAEWDDSHTYCLGLCEEDKTIAYLPPFDLPEIWDGHATIVDELKKQCEEQPDLIICSVGGGGLVNGIVAGCSRNGWDKTDILAVETIGADSLNAAFDAKKLISLPAITSVAKSLGARCVSRQAFDYAVSGRIIPVRVTDEQAVNACRRFADEMRVLVEPACGASLAVMYENMSILNKYRNIVIEICGGSKVHLNDFS